MKRLIFCLAALFAFAACTDDEKPFPAGEMDFLNLVVNSDGYACLARFDSGESIAVAPFPTLFTAGSSPRIIAFFERKANVIALLSYAEVKTFTPLPASGEPSPRDPVRLQSAWLSRAAAGSSDAWYDTPRYLNLHLEIKTHQEKKHLFRFLDSGMTLSWDGKQIRHLHLLHDQAGDPPAFSAPVYLSCAIHSFYRMPPDSIAFHLNTYEKGEVVKTFPF